MCKKLRPKIKNLHKVLLICLAKNTQDQEKLQNFSLQKTVNDVSSSPNFSKKGTKNLRDVL